jgi:hypothetical protein
MPTCRPEIDEDLVRKLKMTFPKETALLGIKETIEWAIQRLIEKAKNKDR